MSDEAMFAGLVHDIGVFYLLSRAVNFPELVANPVATCISCWCNGTTASGMPFSPRWACPRKLVVVVQEHEQERTMERVTTLADILFVANRLANVDHGWRDPAFCRSLSPDGSIAASSSSTPDALATLLADSADDVASLKGCAQVA
jgi:hypothetical protein